MYFFFFFFFFAFNLFLLVCHPLNGTYCSTITTVCSPALFLPYWAEFNWKIMVVSKATIGATATATALPDFACSGFQPSVAIFV